MSKREGSGQSKLALPEKETSEKDTHLLLKVYQSSYNDRIKEKKQAKTNKKLQP